MIEVYECFRINALDDLQRKLSKLPKPNYMDAYTVTELGKSETL